jgi:predicted  nucleic acid-binding Zn-ribbon protein
MKKDGTVQGYIGAGIVFYWIGSPFWPYLSSLNDPDRYCGTMGCYDIFIVPVIFLFVLFCTFISFLFCRFFGRIYYENRMSSAKYSSAWGPERAECPRCTNKSEKSNHKLTYYPSDSGVINYWENRIRRLGTYRCDRCDGELINTKQAAYAFENHPITPNEILEQGSPCGLDCPICSSEMVETTLLHIRKKESYNRLGSAPSPSHPVINAIVLGILVFDYLSHLDQESKDKRTRAINLNGCTDCGSFWFDYFEMSAVESAAKVTEADSASLEMLVEREREWEETVIELQMSEAERRERVSERELSRQARTRARRARSAGRAQNTNCLHIDNRTSKKCRRVTYRSSEYCYVHQSQESK